MSKLSIEEIIAPTNEEWDLIWSECDFATYFQSREWAEILNTYTKGKIYPCPQLICFSDSKKALIPLSAQYDFKGLVKTHISSPVGTFGGWLTTDKLNVTHANLIVEYLLKQYPNLLWRINPYDELISSLKIPSARSDETYAIDLAPGFDVVYKQWQKSQRTKVNHAKRVGVLVKLSDSLEDWNYYYDVLYKDSLRRWGKNTTAKYEKHLFTDLYNRKSPYIKLWLAIYEDKIICGDIIFYAKKHVVGWHNASLEKYFRTRMVNLLVYEAVKDACEKGYRWFDFNPCGGHEGVRRFKQTFGTQEISFPIIDNQTIYKKMLSKSLALAKRIGLGG